MSRKSLIWIFLTIGSTVGAYIPDLWGAGLFSFSSILFSAAGGIGGIWLGFKIGNSFS